MQVQLSIHYDSAMLSGDDINILLGFLCVFICSTYVIFQYIYIISMDQKLTVPSIFHLTWLSGPP
jgi:hypothetical protein